MPPDPADARLHLINPLRNPYGGSERRTIETARLLRRAVPVEVWCAPDAAPSLRHEADARVIDPAVSSFPRHGTLVFVGTYFSVGRWIARASPKRVVIIFNTDQSHWLRDNLSRIAQSGVSAEVLYTSHALRARHGGVGPVLESPIDLAQFAFRDPRDVPPRRFTVGRHSRDDACKHHAEDPALYRRLAAAGIRVRLMGATCIAQQLAGTPGVEVLPEGTEAPLDFLRTLDAFVYRTSDTWYEAFGRVVFEAMAAGVPVACGLEGGYAGYLEHGRSALLGSNSGDLATAVFSLRDDPKMASTMAQDARRTAQQVQHDARRQTFRLLVGAVPADDADSLDAFALTQPSSPGD